MESSPTSASNPSKSVPPTSSVSPSTAETAAATTSSSSSSSALTVLPNNDNRTIGLISSTGERFVVQTRIAIQSNLIRSMLETIPDLVEIPLADIKPTVLGKILEFCTYHVDLPFPMIEKPLKSSNMADLVPPWDANYVNIENEFLFEIILAANFLDIKSLLDLTCGKVAAMVRNKSVEEIRKEFRITNDFSPEEEAFNMATHAWA